MNRDKISPVNSILNERFEDDWSAVLSVLSINDDTYFGCLNCSTYTENNYACSNNYTEYAKNYDFEVDISCILYPKEVGSRQVPKPGVHN